MGRTHVETLKRSLQLKQKGPSTHASVLREVVRRPAWSAGYDTERPTV